KKLIGSRNDRLLKQYRKLVTQINGLEPKISAPATNATQKVRPRINASVSSGSKTQKHAARGNAVAARVQGFVALE
ncbi:hypothetical protein, partial [Achromobacter sp. DMS1]|uniref:hypothetical protein n=1 Tax=Achromobacter sp. DMS1 TaxID=1688405 RepID=UPI001364B851